MPAKTVRYADGEDPARALASRLRARSTEIEARVLERLNDLYALPPGAQAEMLAGAQIAVPDVLAFSIGAFEGGDSWSEPIPDSYEETARYAARIGVSLEEVLRGYSAGNMAISEFVVEEAQHFMDSGLLQSGVEVQNRLAEALISGLSSAYASEVARLENPAASRLAREVERLLAGDPPHDLQLDYRLEHRWHIAAVVSGGGAKQAAERIAASLGCELLSIPRSADTYWAWWGSSAAIEFARLSSAAHREKASFRVAVGEARSGVDGFRRSHREAQLAAAVMIRGSDRITRCLEVMLPAALLEQPEVAELYVSAQLGPLRAQRDWPALREALAGYFSAKGNLASAAAAIGVDRHTVRRRLRKVEQALGTPIENRYAELEVALRLEELASAILVRDS